MEHSDVIRNRGKKKCSLTKLKQYLESKEQFEFTDLAVRLERLETTFNEFCKLDNLLPEDQSEYSDIEDFYLEIKIMIRVKMEAAKCEVSLAVQNRQGNILNDVLQTNTNTVLPSSSVGNIKLPKITIPSFSGKYLDWIYFKDLFKNSVHNNSGLSKVHKFQYLKGLLTGSAEDLIKQIQ